MIQKTTQKQISLNLSCKFCGHYFVLNEYYAAKDDDTDTILCLDCDDAERKFYNQKIKQPKVLLNKPRKIK